ncbi:MAG: hypothetical protein WBZ39_03495 [Methylovirgula sp.]
MDLGLLKFHTWSNDRIAMLGFLVGRGWDSKAIAEALRVSPGAVYKCVRRLGLRFRGGLEVLVVELDPYEISALKGIAAKMNLTPIELAAKILKICAKEPDLVANILDE